MASTVIRRQESRLGCTPSWVQRTLVYSNLPYNQEPIFPEPQVLYLETGVDHLGTVLRFGSLVPPSAGLFQCIR